MKIINTIFVTLCCYFLHVDSYAQQKQPDGRFLDFRRMDQESYEGSVTASWRVSASLKLRENMDSVYFLLSTGNTQTRISVADLIDKQVDLKIGLTTFRNLTSSRWPWKDVPKTGFYLGSLAISVDGKEVVAWTKILDGSLFITSNFRVSLAEDNTHTALVWITDYYNQEAVDNLYRHNSKEHSQPGGTSGRYPDDEAFLRNTFGPIWATLTTQSGFLDPERLAFPTIEELVSQQSITQASTAMEYVESRLPAWERPFLLPPVIALKPELNAKDVEEKLLALQHDVVVAIIKSGGHPGFYGQMKSTSKLLAYYLEVLDDKSPLRGSIEQNLEAVDKEMSKATKRTPVEGLIIGHLQLKTP